MNILRKLRNSGGKNLSTLNVTFDTTPDIKEMPAAVTPSPIPSALEEQPSVLPTIRAVDYLLEDGEPTMPLQFVGDDGPCVAVHMTKSDFENNLRPIGWLRPAIFDYFYRSFPKYNVGKRFVEFVTPQESETEDCMYFSDWAIEEGKEGLEWQFHKIIKHIRDEEEALVPGLLKRWRNEPVSVCADPRSSYFKSKAYKLSPKSKDDPINLVFNIDRSASWILGFAQMFASLFVYEGEGKDMSVWMSKRSETASHSGKLDIGAGGGISAGFTPRETAIKEAYEEIGLSRDFIEPRIRTLGVVSCMSAGFPGVKEIDREYLYELEMPHKDQDQHVELKSIDGKVESFLLMPVKELLDMLINDPLKLHSPVPVIHFLIKHGIITAENEPYYAEVVARCNRLLDYVATPVWLVEKEGSLAPKLKQERKENIVDGSDEAPMDIELTT